MQAEQEDREPPCGLIVDWGGVMTTNVFASFNAFCAAEGLERDSVARMFLAEPGRTWLVDLETGAMPEDEFEGCVGGALGVAPDRLIERLMAGAGPDAVMLRAVRRARDHGIVTGLISNSWGVSRYNADDLRDLFDGTVISGLVGVRKPDPTIYELGVRAVRLRPDECVYVDDLGGNLKPARAMGMTTVLHTGAEATVAELSGIFGVDLT